VKHWAVQDAKARFSELVDTCLKDGPQVVTRRGSETAVLLSFDEWKRLTLTQRPNLKDLLLADHPRFELPRRRRKVRHRTPPVFD
jgi:antitoxin Phd